MKKTNSIWIFNPVPWDRLDPPQGVLAGELKPGDSVRVVKLPGCPKPGTMGHYHIAHPETGRFLGLVHGNSLERTL